MKNKVIGELVWKSEEEQIKKFEEILKDFDAVFDTVGKDIADRSFPVLKKGGVLVSMVVQPDGKLAKKYGIKTSYTSKNC